MLLGLFLVNVLFYFLYSNISSFNNPPKALSYRSDPASLERCEGWATSTSISDIYVWNAMLALDY